MTEGQGRPAWLDPAEDPRYAVGTAARGEHAVVLGYLRHYRLTLELKCDGLDAEQLASRSVPPSTLSLLGLLRHLADVEHHWFRRVLQGEQVPRLFERDEDFEGAVPDPVVVEKAWAAWRREVAAGDAWLAREPSWDTLVRAGDEEVELRDVLVHLVEEYARHAGHADLLRECIDGRIGQ
jgi:uncharacterized damage-inducible protein DinB